LIKIRGKKFLPPYIQKNKKGVINMKKNKKKYVKPEVKKNKHLVNVTFVSGPSVGGTPGSLGPVISG